MQPAQDKDAGVLFINFNYFIFCVIYLLSPFFVLFVFEACKVSSSPHLYLVLFKCSELCIQKITGHYDLVVSLSFVRNFIINCARTFCIDKL